MLSRRFNILVIALCLPLLCLCQQVDYPNEGFYKSELRAQQEAYPLQYVRESDVVWNQTVWRIIDMRERFNQFFYYPIEPEGADGRKNFAYTVWNAIVNGEIEVYEDDEFKIRKDNEAVVKFFTRSDTLTLEIYDEDNEEEFEYRTVFVPREFKTDEIFRLRLKEEWYIDKQATEQYVRITALALVQEQYKDRDGEREYIGSVTLFWIPMLSHSVRTMLARHEAYYEDNTAQMPSWEYIFTARMFSDFITRFSNVYNRAISDYLTGEDAIWESERLENELLNISIDMWEY